MENFLESVISQAEAELPDFDSSNLNQQQWRNRRQQMALEYINQMTNMELLELIDRALS